MQVVTNTLYIQSEPSYAHLEGDGIVLEVEGQEKRKLPLLAFNSLVTFGNVMLSPGLINRCCQDGRAITQLDYQGRFRARIEGPISGNVLLRKAQYDLLNDEPRLMDLCRAILTGKLQNTRGMLMRAARESEAETDRVPLQLAAETLSSSLGELERAKDAAALRGVEGHAAQVCFSVFAHLIRTDRDTFGITGRTRRPPRDPTNALLSFIFTLLTHDCRSALESVGLDPQVGILHALRPGRPALALDLMEEFRSYVGDRLALTLINRGQMTAEDFETRPGGAVQFTDKARKALIVAYVERKNQEVSHPFTGQKVPIALLPFIQARLLARAIRGDLETYPPFVAK